MREYFAIGEIVNIGQKKADLEYLQISTALIKI
jgi:hypothetical protein